MRPSYQHVRRIVRVERRRQELRREARKVLAGAVSTSAAGLVPSVVLVLERLRELQLAEELVLQEHKAFVAARVRELLSLDVAAENHQRFDGFGHELRRLDCVRERVRPWVDRLARIGAGGVDLGLDDAGVSVVDGTEHRDGPAVLARVADEQLPLGLGGRAHGAAFAAAWATVSRSTKPPSASTTSPDRLITSRLGSLKPLSLARTAWATRSFRTFRAR